MREIPAFDEFVLLVGLEGFDCLMVRTNMMLSGIVDPEQE